MSRILSRTLAPWIVTALLLASFPVAAGAATITIVNNDGAGEGFNDPTAATPVGGNPGTTVGAQRLYVFQYAADIWGGQLPSTVQILIRAQFDPQSCTATSGVLGSAGPTTIHRDFGGAPVAGHWYHQALANKLNGSDLSAANPDINITFNSGVGQTGCLEVGWYYGVDGNEGGQIELLPVVLHEMGHGLGFSTSTSGSTGAYASAFPHIWDKFLYSNSLGLHWDQMTAGQRATSATSCNNLVWDGPQVIANAPFQLGDKPLVRINSPAGIAGEYTAGPADFGAPLNTTGVTGNVVLVNDGVGNPENGCETFVNAGVVNGNIALLSRGGCPFTTKVQNAQDAGAIAVIVADSVAGCPPAGLGGSSGTITIPSVRVSQADGNLIEANLPANVTLILDPALLAGADTAGRPKLYAPSTFSGGSSVSHWDVTAEPNLLMEPSITNSISDDTDLAFALFADIGWFQGFAGGTTPSPGAGTRLAASVPNPAFEAATIRYTLDRATSVELAVYDLAGREVARLVDRHETEGEHTVTWDARGRDGRRVPAGVYLYRLRTPGFSESKHLVISQ